MATLSATPQFAWKPEYSVGVDSIDAQHKQLIALTNKLNEAMAAGQGRAVLGAMFDDLIHYTERHFAEEERFMSSIRYPELAAHTAIHRSLTQKVFELRAKFQSAPIANTLEVFGFLKAWLTDHILRSDLAYARYHRVSPLG